MIRHCLVILSLLILLASCSKNEGCVVLNGDYRLWLVSADERYLTYADNVYFLGPRIDGIAEIDPYIFGVNSEHDVEGLKNVPGYFIIDTATGDIYLGMNRKQFDEKITEIGIEELEMVGPGKLFVEKLREYSCI